MKKPDKMAGGANRISRDADLVENQRAAAARCGCDIEAVKLAKAMGSDAFLPNNRISVSRLSAFIGRAEFKERASESAGSEDWQNRLLKAKALREELRLEKDKGGLWESETVIRAYTAGDEAMMSTLRRWLESDLPPLIEGKGAGEILGVNRKFLDELTVELRASRAAAVDLINSEAGKVDIEAEAESETA